MEERARMAEFQVVCRVADVPSGEGKTVIVGDKLVAVFREGDSYFAIDDTCPHMGASLGGGYVENGIVTCPWHAWRFRLNDGAWADNPRIKIAACTMSGKIIGPEFSATARVLPPEQWSEAQRALHRKYWLSRLPFWSKNNVFLEIVVAS